MSKTGLVFREHIVKLLWTKLSRRAGIISLCSLIIVGCSDSDIMELKMSYLPNYGSHTIGQAFDNRKLCKSVSWKKVNDDRGRTLIEYRCEIKGVAQYETAFLQKSLEDLRELAEEGNFGIEIRVRERHLLNFSEGSDSHTRAQEELNAIREKNEESVFNRRAAYDKIRSELNATDPSKSRATQIFVWLVREDGKYSLEGGSLEIDSQYLKEGIHMMVEPAIRGVYDNAYESYSQYAGQGIEHAMRQSLWPYKSILMNL